MITYLELKLMNKLKGTELQVPCVLVFSHPVQRMIWLQPKLCKAKTSKESLFKGISRKYMVRSREHNLTLLRTHNQLCQHCLLEKVHLRHRHQSCWAQPSQSPVSRGKAISREELLSCHYLLGVTIG